MYLYHVCQQENTFKLNRNKNKTWKFKQLRTWTTVFKGHGIHHKVQHKKQSPQWTKWSTVNSSQNSSVRTKPDPLPPPFPHALLPAWTHSRKYGMNQRFKKTKKNKNGKGGRSTYLYCSLFCAVTRPHPKRFYQTPESPNPTKRRVPWGVL